MVLSKHDGQPQHVDSGSSSPTTPGSPGIDSPDRNNFLVVENAEDGIDQTWSFVLTDDETRSTSSSEGEVNNDAYEDYLFSDSDVENNFDTDSVRGYNTSAPRPSEFIVGVSSTDPQGRINNGTNTGSGTPPSLKKLGEGVANYFELPKINLKSQRSKQYGTLPANNELGSWAKRIAALLTLIALNLSAYYYVTYPAQPSSSTDLSLIGSHDKDLVLKPSSTTVLVRTTVTETISLPPQTVTLESFYFPVPEVLKECHAVEKLNHVYDNFIKSTYENKLKNEKLNQKLAESWSQLKEYISDIDDGKISGSAKKLKESSSSLLSKYLSQDKRTRILELVSQNGATLLRSANFVSKGTKQFYATHSPKAVEFASLVGEKMLDNLKKSSSAASKYARVLNTEANQYYSHYRPRLTDVAVKITKDSSTYSNKLAKDAGKVFSNTKDAVSSVEYEKYWNKFKTSVSKDALSRVQSVKTFANKVGESTGVKPNIPTFGNSWSKIATSLKNTADKTLGSSNIEYLTNGINRVVDYTKQQSDSVAKQTKRKTKNASMMSNIIWSALFDAEI